MRRSIFCFLLGPCLFCAAVSPSPALTDHNPKMVIEETRFDFGEVNQWDRLEHVFTIINQGDEFLRIEKVSPD